MLAGGALLPRRPVVPLARRLWRGGGAREPAEQGLPPSPETRGQLPDCNRCTLRPYHVTALRRPQARSCPMAEHDGQLNHSSDSAPFLLAGFVRRQIRPRLPPSRAKGAAFFAEIVQRTISYRSSPPWQARSAPAQAGAAGLSASCLGRAPCLRACALRQPDRENAPPERFQSVLWRRSCGAWPGPLPDGGSHRAKGFWTGIRLGDQAAPARSGAAGLLPSCLRMAPCLRACALRQPDRENASPERFQAVLRVHDWRTPAGPVA
jgi:hypothetical protein